MECIECYIGVSYICLIILKHIRTLQIFLIKLNINLFYFYLKYYEKNIPSNAYLFPYVSFIISFV